MRSTSEKRLRNDILETEFPPYLPYIYRVEVPKKKSHGWKCILGISGKEGWNAAFYHYTQQEVTVETIQLAKEEKMAI